MITVDDYVASKRLGTSFVLTAANLQAASADEFHDAVAPCVIARGGNGFVVTGEPVTESQTGQRLFALVHCMRTS